jgi:pyruvate/2-oxoglutarate dehydrogenase complex dihydrolipoamide acyltransferase (E2) component
MLPLCLAYDHRVLDGANAVRFLKDVIAALQSFDEADVIVE